MSTLTIELADDLRARAQARAAQAGYATLAEYLSSLMRADIEASEAVAALPARVTFSTREELESKLAEALDGGSREVDLDEWMGEHVRRLTLRQDRSKAG
jgi:hypothetical protein